MLAGMAKFYVDGGFWMHPITAVSVIGVAIAIERVISLLFRYRIATVQFVAQIQKLILANNIDRAIKLCNTAPKAPIAKVLRSALIRANKGESEIAHSVEEATLEVVPEITKRASTLQQVASLATLLGLLGTIIGLIDAFDAVATAPPDMKTTMLTKSISIAMNTTAYGLIVAIPTTAVYVYLSGVIKTMLDEIDQYSVKIQNLLVARGKGTLAQP